MASASHQKVATSAVTSKQIKPRTSKVYYRIIRLNKCHASESFLQQNFKFACPPLYLLFEFFLKGIFA